MDIVILILTIIGIVAAVVFGFLQVIVPFVKREVRFSKRFPFVASLEAAEKSRYQPFVDTRSKIAVNSIAVLPLENLGSAEDEYFAAGMTEEITSRLAAIRDLGVISRTSANQYAKTNKTIRQIGSELGVEYILEGSVRWARTPDDPGRVRITPQLIRVFDDTHLWADTYDRVLDDIFEIQSDIAQKVVEQLGITLLEQERKAVEKRWTENLEAYHAYLRARYFATRPHFSIDNWKMVVEHAQRAVQLDPCFTRAYVELSKAHAKFYFFWYDHSEKRRLLARSAVDRAAALSSDSPQVHLALGLHHLWVYRDPKKALEELALAERGLPNSGEVIEAKAAVFELQGRWDDALDAYKRAFELSPRDASLPTAIAIVSWIIRRYELAIDACDQALAIAPNEAWPYLTKTFTYWSWKGDIQKSRVALRGVPKDHAWSPWAWYWQEIFAKQYHEAINQLFSTPDEWIRIKICARPKLLLAAFAYELLNEPQRALEEYESARTMLEKEAKLYPDDPRYHGSLGIAYACLGNKENAIKQGKQAVKILPISKDAFYGIPYVQDLAHIYTILGEYDAALDQLEYLLSIPSWFSASWIAIDPRWDRLRDRPRFQELTK